MDFVCRRTPKASRSALEAPSGTFNVVPEKTKSFSHPAVHRRTNLRKDSPKELKRTEATEERQLEAWIVDHIMKALNELPRSVQKMTKSHLHPYKIVTVPLPEFRREVLLATFHKAQLLDEGVE